MSEKTLADFILYVATGMIFLGLLTVAFGSFSAAITADFGGWPGRVAWDGIRLCMFGLPAMMIAIFCGGDY